MWQPERIVITGMSINTPLGDTLDGFLDGLLAGRSALSKCKKIDVENRRGLVRLRHYRQVGAARNQARSGHLQRRPQARPEGALDHQTFGSAGNRRLHRRQCVWVGHRHNPDGCHHRRPVGRDFEGKSVINYVLPRDEVSPKAFDLAARIAEKPRYALVALKCALSSSRRQAFEAARTSESLMHDLLHSTQYDRTGRGCFCWLTN